MNIFEKCFFRTRVKFICFIYWQCFIRKCISLCFWKL